MNNILKIGDESTIKVSELLSSQHLSSIWD